MIIPCLSHISPRFLIKSNIFGLCFLLFFLLQENTLAIDNGDVLPHHHLSSGSKRPHENEEREEQESNKRPRKDFFIQEFDKIKELIEKSNKTGNMFFLPCVAPITTLALRSDAFDYQEEIYKVFEQVEKKTQCWELDKKESYNLILDTMFQICTEQKMEYLFSNMFKDKDLSKKRRIALVNMIYNEEISRDFKEKILRQAIAEKCYHKYNFFARNSFNTNEYHKLLDSLIYYFPKGSYFQKGFEGKGYPLELFREIFEKLQNPTAKVGVVSYSFYHTAIYHNRFDILEYLIDKLLEFNIYNIKIKDYAFKVLATCVVNYRDDTGLKVLELFQKKGILTSALIRLRKGTYWGDSPPSITGPNSNLLNQDKDINVLSEAFYGGKSKVLSFLLNNAEGLNQNLIRDAMLTNMDNRCYSNLQVYKSVFEYLEGKEHLQGKRLLWDAIKGAFSERIKNNIMLFTHGINPNSCENNERFINLTGSFGKYSKEVLQLLPRDNTGSAIYVKFLEGLEAFSTRDQNIKG